MLFESSVFSHVLVSFNTDLIPFVGLIFCRYETVHAFSANSFRESQMAADFQMHKLIEVQLSSFAVSYHSSCHKLSYCRNITW